MRWGRVISSVLAPVLLSSGWIAWLLWLATAPVGPSERAKEMDAELDQSHPEILILGNSSANRGIDPEQLGGLLERPAHGVTIAASLAPTWYVVLRDRVYARGLDPEVVIIADTPPGMLAVESFSENLHAKMLELTSGPDPVRAREWVDKTPLERSLSMVSVASSRVRETLLDGLRNTVVGLLFAPQAPATLQTRGNMTADAAVEAVLHAGGIRAAGPEGALALDLRQPQDVTAVEHTSPAESFVKDTIDLVQAHGGTLVYVHLPRRSGVLDEVTFESRAMLVDYLNAREVWFVDLSVLPHADALFADNNHLLPEGRALLTETLASKLADSGILDGGSFVAAAVPAERATVTREGEPDAVPLGRLERRDGCTYVVETPDLISAPTLAALRVPASPLVAFQNGKPLRRTTVDEPGCTGTFVSLADRMVIHPSAALGAADRLSVEFDPDVPQQIEIERRPLAQLAAVSPSAGGAAAWWVYPGTTLVLVDPMSPPSPVPLDVRSTALVVVLGRSHPRFTVQGSRVRYIRDGRLLRSAPVETSGDEPLTVTWSSPRGGPTLLVRDLVLGSGEVSRHVLGSRDTVAVKASFLPSEESGATVRYESAAPRLVRGPVQTIEEGQGNVTVIDGPVLPMGVASTVAGRKHCTPVVVSLDGLKLEARPTTKGIEFEIPPDKVARVGDAQPYLDPERRCSWWPAEGKGTGKSAGPLFMEPLKIARWLYPGDVATFNRPDIAEMHGRATALRVEGFRFGPDAELAIELTSGEVTERFVLDSVQGEIEETFLLATRLDPRTTGAVSLRLQSPADGVGFFYLTDVHLLEAEPE